MSTTWKYGELHTKAVHSSPHFTALASKREVTSLPIDNFTYNQWLPKQMDFGLAFPTMPIMQIFFQYERFVWVCCKLLSTIRIWTGEKTNAHCIPDQSMKLMTQNSLKDHFSLTVYIKALGYLFRYRIKFGLQISVHHLETWLGSGCFEGAYYPFTVWTHRQLMTTCMENGVISLSRMNSSGAFFFRFAHICRSIQPNSEFS